MECLVLLIAPIIFIVLHKIMNNDPNLYQKYNNSSRLIKDIKERLQRK